MNIRFISIEGIEGSGKSTVLPYIVKRCEHYAKRTVHSTREPGGTPCAEAIRQIFLNHFDETIYPETELLLVYAARMQHIQNSILPRIDSGEIVVCDRFFDSSIAYQGGGAGLEKEYFDLMNQLVVRSIVPDITFLLDLPVDLAFSRITNRSEPDRMEQKSHQIFERIRQAYLEQAASQPKRFKIIDASQSQTAIETNIDHILQQAFE